MDTCDKYMTSYRAAHKFIPTVVFESNVSSLNSAKESRTNNPNLKQWNYDTTAIINNSFKENTMDPMQRPTRVHIDQMNYMMPQWEKYWSNPPKPTSMPPTEYRDEYIQPELMTNINQIQIPTTCVQPKPMARNEIVLIKTPKISDMGVIRKIDPYVSTQKLAYTEINPIAAQNLNSKKEAQEQIMPKYESFYNEPIFNRKNTIRLLPNTLKHVPHNALKTEMSASYTIPLNTLSKFEGTIQMPISISRNPTLSQVLSVPGMYTSEYSKIGG